jgi:hypothetical protein
VKCGTASELGKFVEDWQELPRTEIFEDIVLASDQVSQDIWNDSLPDDDPDHS